MTQFSLDRVEDFAIGLDHAEGIAETPDGSIYVGGEAGQIFRLSSGRASLVTVLPGEGLILGLASRSDGSLLVCDAGSSCIWRVIPATGAYEVFTDRSPEGLLILPNWGCFIPDGRFLFTDSGHWKGSDGRIMVVGSLGGEASTWCTELRAFPNGMALSEDGSSVWIVESAPGRLWNIPIKPDGRAGSASHVTDVPGVPDGVAALAGGGVVISNYRPDVVWLWTEGSGLTKVLEDPEGTVLASPTNVLFTGPEMDDMVWPNLGRWHVSVIRSSGLTGAPLLRL